MNKNADVPLARSTPNGCEVAQRDHAAKILKKTADDLRRRAGEMHKQADLVESLARSAEGMTGPSEEALWQLAVNYGNPF